MKKWIVPALLLALLVALFAPAALSEEAEESNEGEVIVIDDLDELDDFGEDEDGENDAPEADEDCQPFIPEQVDRAIFGPDNRIRVYEPSVYPFSTIAYMEVRGSCNCSWTGTGFMIGRDRLLTAAHCLVCPRHSKWAKYIDFYFGYKGRKNYLYRYSGHWTARVGNMFRNHTYTTASDYGCVKFDKNVGSTTGWLGTWYGMSNARLESTGYVVAGYRGGALTYDTGYAKKIDGNLMGFTMDTLPGNSGGPVFTGDHYAVGIIIAQSAYRNTAHRLTSSVKRCVSLTR